MDWQTIETIRRERVVPELEDWAAEIGPARPEAPGVPLPWMIKMIVNHVGFRSSEGPIGHAIHDRWHSAPAYEAMSAILAAKHGVIGSHYAEQAEFLRGLEHSFRRMGPLDNLDGTGPGKALAVHRDPTGRLHNPAGPAIVFGDRSLYALRGVNISVEEWELRDDATAILGIANVEARRALIENMGIPRFIAESGLQCKHRDGFGSFYRLDNFGIVHVVCPSTKQEYFLKVPENCRSAHEAVAWTFSMVPEDYQPVKEA